MKLQRLFKGSGMALWSLFCVAILSGFSPAAWAMTEGAKIGFFDLTAASVGYVAVCVFVLAYVLVMAEETLHFASRNLCSLRQDHLGHDRFCLYAKRHVRGVEAAFKTCSNTPSYCSSCWWR